MNRVLGRWIAVLRTDCGMSRRKLAERLGVTTSTVEQWESESATVPPELISALADSLHVSAEQLLSLEAHSRLLPPRDSRGPRPARKRPLPYPVQGSLADMLDLAGSLAWSLSAQAEQRLGRPLYHRTLQQLPRDCTLQLLAMHHLLARGAELRRASLLELGCGLMVTRRTRPVFDGDRERQVLVVTDEDAQLIFAPQVTLRVPECPHLYRADLLALYADAYGHLQWFDITVEPAATPLHEHVDCPLALGLPRLRFHEGHVLRPDFDRLLVAEARRYMTSDVVHGGGVTTLRVRQPARFNAPSIVPTKDVPSPP